MGLLGSDIAAQMFQIFLWEATNRILHLQYKSFRLKIPVGRHYLLSNKIVKGFSAAIGHWQEKKIKFEYIATKH